MTCVLTNEVDVEGMWDLIKVHEPGVDAFLVGRFLHKCIVLYSTE